MSVPTVPTDTSLAETDPVVALKAQGRTLNELHQAVAQWRAGPTDGARTDASVEALGFARAAAAAREEARRLDEFATAFETAEADLEAVERNLTRAYVGIRGALEQRNTKLPAPEVFADRLQDLRERARRGVDFARTAHSELVTLVDRLDTGADELRFLAARLPAGDASRLAARFDEELRVATGTARALLTALRAAEA